MSRPNQQSRSEHLDTLTLTGQVAEITRELTHRTRHSDAIEDPADLCRLLGHLAWAAAIEPQLLEQLRHWLRDRHDSARLRSDTGTDAATLVADAVDALTHAFDSARCTADLLDVAHNHGAHLALD
jgi:hypothetical protein